MGAYHLRRLLKDLIQAKQKKRHNVQPAPSSSRTSHSCNSHEAFEGTVPDLHSSGLLRVQRASRTWTWLWTWSQRCLQPGLCQRWLCDPGQARPCVHRISFLFSGTSRRPPPSSPGPPPSAPGQPPYWPVHRQPPAPPTPPALPQCRATAALPPHPVPRLTLPWPWTQDCQQIRVNIKAIVICARNNLKRALN